MCKRTLLPPKFVSSFPRPFAAGAFGRVGEEGCDATVVGTCGLLNRSYSTRPGEPELTDRLEQRRPIMGYEPQSRRNVG